MHENLFGNIDGANDPLLMDCFIAPGSVEDMPIVVGRWGTGKTSLLIYRNAQLSDALRISHPSDREIDRIWYMSESSTDHHVIHQIRSLYAEDAHGLKRAFEMLWRSEILNCAARTLHALHKFYGSPGGEHWDDLIRISSEGEYGNIWTTIATLLKVALPSSRHSALEEFLAVLRKKDVVALTEAIHLCLKDIEGFEIQPAVCIEPIETPYSDIEQEEDLAQMLVTCLLNTYFEHFRLSPARQLLRVEISIPWHRYRKPELMQPQKMSSYIGNFDWRKDALRKFINKRIAYEFRRVGRKITKVKQRTAWRLLFPDTVNNGNSQISAAENSFDYILRHSQYRTRDIILLVRKCVVLAAAEADRTVEEILKGRHPVSRAAIVHAVREVSKELAEDREIEAARLMPEVRQYVEALKGMPVPFTLDNLERRAKKTHAAAKIDKPIALLQKLWEAGFVGLRLSTSSPTATNQLLAQFGRNAQSPSDKDGELANFYVYEHTTGESAYDILTTHDRKHGRSDHADIEVEIVTHPMMFEHLANRVNLKTPIGI